MLVLECGVGQQWAAAAQQRSLTGLRLIDLGDLLACMLRRTTVEDFSNIVTEVAIIALEPGITAQLQVTRQRKASIMSLFAYRLLYVHESLALARSDKCPSSSYEPADLLPPRKQRCLYE